MSFQSITTWATSMSPLWAARRGTTEKRICFYSVMLSETPLGWVWKSIQGWAKEVDRERWLDYQGRCNAGVEEGFWDCGQAGERRSLSPLYPSTKRWHLFSSLGSYKVSKLIPQGVLGLIKFAIQYIYKGYCISREQVTTEQLNSAGSTLIESNATPSVRCPVDNLVSDVEVILIQLQHM